MVLNGVARQLALPAAVALAVVGDAEGYAHCEASGMGWVCIKLSVFHGGLRHPVTRNRCGAWAGAAGLQSISASRDRKSTRLNSSHLVISYAVFCLKKKA